MKWLKTRSYNIDAAIKAVIMLGFALFFFQTIRSGEVLKYVHPRNVPVIKFAAVAMALIAGFLLPEVFKPQRVKTGVGSFLFFVVPLLMAVLLPTQSFHAASLSYGSLSADGGLANKANSDTNTTFVDKSENFEGEPYYDTSVEEYPDGETVSNTDTYGVDVSPFKVNKNEFQLVDGTIVIDSDNYVKWMEELYDNLDKYIGKKIEVEGFVYRDEQFKGNEFALARMMMVCCAADMQTIGFLCSYQNIDQMQLDAWIKVYGTVEKGESDGSEIAMIKVEQVENTEKPEIDYVYPY